MTTMHPTQRPCSVTRGAIALSQAFLLGPVPLVFLAWIQDWYVDVNGPACPGTGTQADPFCAIGDAVTAAADGDTIHIAPGTYLEHIVLDKDLDLIGTGGEQVTILDGNAAGRVVLVNDSVVSLSGLTLTNGYVYGSSGGGLLMDSTSSVVLANSTVSQNSAVSSPCGRSYCGGSGGGIASDGQLTITNSTVIGNSGSSDISCAGGSATLISSTISGSGINSYNATLTLTSTSVASSYFGIGAQGGQLTLVSTVASGYYAGVLVCNGGDVRIVNSLVASQSGLGVAAGPCGVSPLLHAGVLGDAEIVNSTITGSLNSVELVGYTASMTNCILWGSSPYIDQSSVTMTYSNVQGGWPGVGNIDADPFFADPLNGNFRLLQGSPCIDAGSNVAVPPDILLDLAGRNRFIEDSLTPDTGRPGRMRPLVDMGAYEGPFFQGRRVRMR